MPYYTRMMQPEDVRPVTEIDREAFSTQWPPPNYKRELQSNLSHYIVAIDSARIGIEAEPPAAAMSILMGVLGRISRWFSKLRAPPPRPEKEFIIGFAGLWLIAGEAHITSIAVREKYRGQKVGELLLIALAELAIKLKAHSITLEVRASNMVAQSLYNKYGFTQVGRRRGYYTDNREDAILMSTPAITSADFQERFLQLKRDYLLSSKQMLRENSLSGKR